MLRTNERTVHFYEFICTSHSRKFKNPACANIYDLMKIVAGAKGLKGWEIYRSNNVAIEVADVKLNDADRSLVLLINRADRNVSDVTFKDFNTRARRKAGKQKADGIEASSHVLIRADEEENKAILQMTMGAGVTCHHVEKLFKEIVVSSSKDKKYSNLFEFNDPNGVDKYSVKYSFEALGLKGSHLDDAFANGAFQGFTLVAAVQEKFDAGGNFRIIEQELEVVAPTPQLANTNNFVNSLKAYMRRSPIPYDRVRIRYKKPGGDDTARATIPINELDAAFGKREKIYLNGDIEDQQNFISNQIVDRMKALMP